MLAKGAFRREAEDLRRYGETYPGWPKGRVPHLLDTNDLYVRVAGELDAILGPHPAWEWRDERRAHDEYRIGGSTVKHQPDAEVRLATGHVFFVERQTERARETAGAIREKVARHAARADHLGKRGEARILFACDTGRDVGYALDAARSSGLPVFAGCVDEAASYLADEALRLS
jgi:hypothetical protein